MLHWRMRKRRDRKLLKQLDKAQGTRSRHKAQGTTKYQAPSTKYLVQSTWQETVNEIINETRLAFMGSVHSQQAGTRSQTCGQSSCSRCTNGNRKCKRCLHKKARRCEYMGSGK